MMKKLFPRVSIQALIEGNMSAVESFAQSLAKNGFGILRLDGSDDSRVLREALLQCQSMGEFRFPPVDEEADYQEQHRACFRTLFRITRQCLKALLNGHKSFEPVSTRLLGALDESFSEQYTLFGEDGEDNYPFDNDDVAFATSFFNIFDYDHGLLNTHRDRCLVTAIFVHQDETVEAPKSALWVKDIHGQWVNTDAAIEENEIVILLGEEFHALAESVGLSLWAAEHCIRVDPTGPDLARAHHRPDPDTPPKGNRMSAALILSH